MHSKGLLTMLLLLSPTIGAAQEPALIPPPAATTVGQDDVNPSIVVYAQGDTLVTVGALLQLHLVPYIGDDAQIDDDDPAAREGFRLRRARLGMEASLPHELGFLLVLNPLESDPETGGISEARLSWSPSPSMRIWAGADKVPFSRAELMSSANLASIERPLTARTLVPQRRLGAALEGHAIRGYVSYVLGVMNATEGYELGNQFSGLLGVGRLEASVAGIGLGLGAFYEDGPGTKVIAASADLGVRLGGGASFLVEAICDRTKPEDAPETSPEVPDTVRRCGGYAEAQYRLPGRNDLTPAVRLEWIDDNLDVDDAGDAWLVSAGVNYRPWAHIRMQLHYLGRYERHGAERANDAVVLSLQGEL